MRVLAAALAAGVVALAAQGASAQAEKRVTWKMHSPFTAKLSVIGTGGVRIAENVTKLSGGALTLKFFEPGALVPAFSYFDALSTGALDISWSIASIMAGKAPALSFYGAVPFGPDFGEFLAWMRYGGGQELQNEIYARFGVKPILCGMIPPEAGGWFRNELKSIDQLKGLKMRIGSYGAKTYEKLGASAQLLAGGDIYPALELGTIDATEFSLPSIDETVGFYQVAKHYYFPGWHQPSTLMELAVNAKSYETLSEHNKFVLDQACTANIAENMAEGEALQFEAIRRMKDKGVIIHRFPKEFLDKFEAAWKEVIAEEAAKDPEVKKVWESLSAFRAKYAIWHDLQKMN
jgi:TRAP-type mannitol/chloroaromatic compound transport system substrate-binding protein